MASLKRKQPSGHGAIMGYAPGTYSPPGGIFGLCPTEPLRRNGQERRKNKLSWVEHTFTPFFDGYLWRKYGEKTIKDSPFPRRYYRCSYREEKKCLASKQVQQENMDDPPMYMVTYEHQHTCNSEPVPAPDVTVGVAEAEPLVACKGLVLRFGSAAAADAPDHRDSQMQQYQQHVPPPPFSSTMSLQNLNSHQPVFPCNPPVKKSSSWFPTEEAALSSQFHTEEVSLMAPPSTNDEGAGLFSTWNSFVYGLEDQLHFGDYVNFSGCMFSSENDECSLSHLGTGIEGEESYF
ncbi:hypothetical protein ACP4OV_024459 [Aristida adscensionis]